MDTDIRARTDGLGWVTSAIFPDNRVRLAITASARKSVGTGERDIARFLVSPSADRPKFLLPHGSRRVTAASVLSYNAMRPWKVRSARFAIGMGTRTGLADLLRMPVLTATAPTDVDVTEVSLVAHLSALLGIPDLYAAVGIRPPDPNHKPTLQLFDGQGRPRGYAKIGWNDATRALVRNEAAALAGLPERPADPAYPSPTRLLTAFAWQGREVAVIEPLPASTRRLPENGAPRLDALLAIARRGGPATPPAGFGDSPYLAGLRERASAATAGDPSLSERIGDLLDRLADRHGATAVEFGDWHGDWVPWNLGTAGGRLMVWDWEHSRPGVPLGFDLAHEGFNVPLTQRGIGAAASAREADDLVRAHAGALGLDPAGAALVVDAYLVEMWVRTATLAAGGAGWNPDLHPALLDALTTRLA